MKGFWKILFFVCLILVCSCKQALIIEDEWELLGSGFEFPEGPAWNPGEGNLILSNCYGDRISQIRDGETSIFLMASDSTFTQTNGIFLSINDKYYACDFGVGAIQEISQDGKSKIFISGFKGERFNGPNDLIVLRNGDIYFSDPKNHGPEKLDGRLFYYNAKMKKVFLVADKLAFPNGLAISPLDNKLYLSESAKSRVLRFDIGEDGLLSGREVFIVLAGGDPDGLDFDIKGNLFVPHFGSGTLFIVSPDGTILQEVKTPGNNTSNVEFGGKDLRTLYITEDETNSVYKVGVKYPGYKLNTNKR